MNYQLALRHFKYFLTVAEELHFRKAAEKLFISQPGLSTQIKQMEELLETPLFVRDKKQVKLTPAGQFLKKEINFIFNHLEQTMKQVKLMGEGRLGEIRIGFLGSAMQQVVPNLLIRLNGQFPEIHTSLEELSNRSQVSGILNDRLDLGFVRLGRVPEGLYIRPVFEDTFSLVLPADHPLDETNFKGVDCLAHDEFILFSQDYSPLYYDTVVSICEDAGFFPSVSHKSVHAQTVFKLVENNLGVAIVPTTLQHGFQMKVKFIELKSITQRATLSVVWKGDNRNPVLQKCLDMLLD